MRIKPKGYHKNPRQITEQQFAKLRQNLQELGDISGIVHDLNTNELIGGNQRSKAVNLAECEIELTNEYAEPTRTGTIAEGYVLWEGERYSYRQVRWTAAQCEQANITANKLGGDWDFDILANEFEFDDLIEYGFKDFELVGFFDDAKPIDDTDGEGGETKPKGSLLDRFGVPPFSILDSRQGYWQDRKRSWLALGIQSEEGRKEDLSITALTPSMYDEKAAVEKKLGRDITIAEYKEKYCTKSALSSTSVFDPVLTELSYRWFMPSAGGTILDPFAGGSVRGIVAAKLGYPYWGNDLREEQVMANREQAADILEEGEPVPTWTVGPSQNLDTIWPEDLQADLVFSCPPYADLEVYSDLQADISNMPYKEFLADYKQIIAKACAKLKPNRFAVFVVGEVRAKAGEYYNFVGDTIAAFQAAGLVYYNEMILINTAASLAIRVARPFNKSRKVGKCHQNVLVFYKGDLSAIKANFGELDISEEESPQA